MHVEALDAAREPEWTAFVDRSSEALIYYDLTYRDILAAVTGGEPRYLVALRGDDVVGVMPSFWREGPYGWVGNALPFFGSYGSPLGVDAPARSALLSAWNDMCAQSSVAAHTMVVNPLTMGLDPPVVFGEPTDWRLGQFSELGHHAYRTKDGLAESLESSVRRNLRTADRAGIRVRHSPNYLSDVLVLHEENMRALGGLAKPHAFFDACRETLEYGDQYRVYGATVDGDLVAGILLLYGHGVVEYFTPGISPEGRRTHATAQILAEAIVDASSRGFRLWNWGGTWPDQDGVMRFKTKWGAQGIRYDYFTKVRSRQLLRATAQELSESYPHFYVLPYAWLE